MRQNIKNDVPEEWRQRAKAGLCPVCGKVYDEFDKGQKVFCTKKCREEYASKYTMWSEVREKILKRDDYSCRVCGTSVDNHRESNRAEKDRRLLEWANQNADRIGDKRDRMLVDLDEDYAKKYARIMTDLHIANAEIQIEEEAKLFKDLSPYPQMEVDHIKAVALGGDMWDESNMRTLCDICHKKKTAEDMGKLKALRR